MPIIDLDMIAREVVEVESTRRSILKAFPDAAGERSAGVSASVVPPIDRAKLGVIVFSDAGARSKLNQLMKWPILSTTLKRVWEAYWAGVKVVVVDAPLLFESGLDKICSVTVTVFIDDEEEQINRLLERDAKLVASSGDTSRKPLTKEEAKARIDAQMSIAQKRKLSTYEIDNSGTVKQLEESVDLLLTHIKSSHRPMIPRNSVITYGVTLFFLALMLFGWLLTRKTELDD